MGHCFVASLRRKKNKKRKTWNKENGERKVKLARAEEAKRQARWRKFSIKLRENGGWLTSGVERTDVRRDAPIVIQIAARYVVQSPAKVETLKRMKG